MNEGVDVGGGGVDKVTAGGAAELGGGDGGSHSGRGDRVDVAETETPDRRK